MCPVWVENKLWKDVHRKYPVNVATQCTNKVMLLSFVVSRYYNSTAHIQLTSNSCLLLTKQQITAAYHIWWKKYGYRDRNHFYVKKICRLSTGKLWMEKGRKRVYDHHHRCTSNVARMLNEKILGFLNL